MTANTPDSERAVLADYADELTDSTLDVTWYPYGQRQHGRGIQVTLTKGDQVQAVRLPYPVARALAAKISAALDNA